MSVKKELDPRTVLGIVFIFISLGLAVNKPLSSHILLLACDVYLLTSKAYRECVLYSMIDDLYPSYSQYDISINNYFDKLFCSEICHCHYDD